MKQPSFLVRMRGLVRRVLFWLPSSVSEEQNAPEIHHDHALVLSVVAPERVPRLQQLRHILRFLNPSESRLFLFAFLVCVLSLGTAATALMFSRTISVPVSGGTYTEAVVGDPKHLNPLDAQTNDVDRDLVRLIYSGLFKLNGTDVIPDIAQDYTWSDDHKTLTVHLRKDARFHDGVQLTSDDVRFTIESAQDPARKSLIQNLFHGVTVTVSDDATVVFTLDQTDPQFLLKLTLGILPAHLWQNIPAANASLSDLNIKPIGSGPFRVKSFLRDNLGSIHSYTLEGYDRYYGTKPFLSTVVFQFFADQISAEEALKADLVDAVAFIGSTDAQKMSSSGRKQDIHVELPQETVVFFNLKNTALATKEVREALAEAISKQDIIAAQQGSAKILTGPYPFAESSSTETNVEHARLTLTRAGWVLPPNGNVRVWSPPKAAPQPQPTPPKKKGSAPTPVAPVAPAATAVSASSTELAITISYPDDANLAAVADSIKRTWSLLGVRVTLEPLPTGELMRRATRERSTQVVLLNILLGSDQDIFPFWWSGQATDRGLNISNLKDRDVDNALDATRTATSTDALLTDRERVSAAILATTPAIFLSRPVQHYLISTKIKGIPADTIALTPAERFQTIDQWYEKMGWRWK